MISFHHAGRLVFFFIFLATFLYLTYHLFEGQLGLKAWREIRVRHHQLLHRLGALQKQANLYETKLLRFTNKIDPDLLEERVRGELGYVHPNDIVVLDSPSVS
jgi:cell division protein FtsB